MSGAESISVDAKLKDLGRFNKSEHLKLSN